MSKQGDTIELEEIAKRLDVSVKHARAKLRDLGLQPVREGRRGRGGHRAVWSRAAVMKKLEQVRQTNGQAERQKPPKHQAARDARAKTTASTLEVPQIEQRTGEDLLDTLRRYLERLDAAAEPAQAFLAEIRERREAIESTIKILGKQ